ncbi:MAG: GNAT family N-acetyltransferase [Candidatus Hydrogenedens sp.]|nr:GNAT family N-acetyltransferase [Candidatus Hydrogenedens sp.]
MIFDIHVHIDRKSNDYKNYSTIAYKNGIFKSVIFPFTLENIERVDESNQYIIESFNFSKELFIPFFLISNNHLDSINPNVIAGFKEHFVLGKNTSFFFPAYEFLQSHNLFLLIHPGSLKRFGLPEKLIEYKIGVLKNIKKNFPKLKIILAHSGRNLPFRSKGVIESVRELKSFEDIFFDTSTIRSPETIKNMIEFVGNNRILFGSDYPYPITDKENIYKLEKETVFKANIPDSTKEDIFINNFKRLFLKDFWVRRVCKTDLNNIISLLNYLDSIDKKHLAISKKINKIKHDIKQERHIYLLENYLNKLLGFIRVSGLPKNGVLIQEIVVHPDFRKKGLAKFLIDIIVNKFQYIEAKTFNDNEAINRILNAFSFEIIKKSSKGNILYWKK